MTEGTGKIVGVYLGAGKGAGKTAVDVIELIAGHGVAGDSHAGQKTERQISLFENEVLQAVNAEGIALTPEELSVNLLTENLRLDSLPPGAMLRIGYVLLEITEERKPCGSLTRIDKRLPKRLYRNLGVFARIFSGGAICAGAAVETITSAHPQTIA
ncbi:MAG: MOSC domain-containing protein [Blastocatellia bacterium]